MKPTALCSVVDKENSIESPLDFATITIVAMHSVSHSPHVHQLTSLSHAVTVTVTVTISVTLVTLL